MKRIYILFGITLISFFLFCGKDNGPNNTIDPSKNPPVVTATAPDSVTINDSITITATATDNGTVVRFAWSKNGTPYSDTTIAGSFKTAFSDSGRNVVSVKAIDNDGVWSAPDSCVILVTTHHPSVKAMAGTSVNINDSITITATADDNDYGTVVKYLWTKNRDTTSDTTTEGSLKTAFSTSGTNVVKVRAMDDDGLLSLPDSCVLNVTLDAPILTSSHDTVVSRTMSVTIHVSARDTNRTGSVQKYYWDIGVDGWDDSTADPQKTFSNPSGGTLKVVWAARDDDGVFSRQDMISIRFNNPPAHLKVASPLEKYFWVHFNFSSGKGTIPLALSASDTDGTRDTLTYTLYLGASADSLVQVFSGKATQCNAPDIDSSATVYWRLKVNDLYGDTTTASDTFVSPHPYPPGMVVIPAGTFQMGQMEITDTVHSVTLSSFWMDTTEVTQADYQALMGSNPSFLSSEAKRPVDSVSWFDAVRYCNTRSKNDGLDTVYNTSSGEADFSKNGYRLPTEAEWEYACRAGTTTPFPFDSAAINDYAWSIMNTSETKPVAQKKKNAFGLHDMCGNVIEWCNDWYGNDVRESETNPTGPASGSERICRGGSYLLTADQLRSAVRSSRPPTYKNQSMGFRVVLPVR